MTMSICRAGRRQKSRARRAATVRGRTLTAAEHTAGRKSVYGARRQKGRCRIIHAPVRSRLVRGLAAHKKNRRRSRWVLIPVVNLLKFFLEQIRRTSVSRARNVHGTTDGCRRNTLVKGSGCAEDESGSSMIWRDSILLLNIAFLYCSLMHWRVKRVFPVTCIYGKMTSGNCFIFAAVLHDSVHPCMSSGF